MKFAEFAKYLARIEAVTARLEITSLLAKLYKQLKPEEAALATYLLMGRLSPNYKGIELNLAVKLMIRVVASAFNQPVDKVTALYKQLGDLGDAAFQLASQQKRSAGSLSITQVYEQLLKTASQEGTGSVERKMALMTRLIGQLGPYEVKYLVRVPIGALRLGFSELTILDALSWLLVGDKSLRGAIEAGFNVRSDIGLIVKTVLEYRSQALSVKAIKSRLKTIQAVPGIPIRPALAARLSSFEEIIDKLGEHALEPKYDGLRTQVHVWRPDKPSQRLLLEDSRVQVKTFSRNLEDITLMFPEISQAASRLLDKFNLQAVILDSESIAYDPDTGRFYPFQETIKRKRKYGINKAKSDLPVKTFVFDILYHDRQDVMQQSLQERRRYLEHLLVQPVGCLELTPQHKVADTKQMAYWFNQYIDDNLEGIMSKKLESAYQAGSRNFSWVKFKPSALSGVKDTLDLVVLGWYAGRGKRSQFGIGAFLVGIYDDKQDRYLTVSKIGTGLTDKQWRQLYQRCQKLKVTKQPTEYRVPRELSCDFWVKPSLVVEILSDEMTKSPLHTSGYALRFPRLISFRDDKKPQQATTLAELKQIFSRNRAGS